MVYTFFNICAWSRKETNSLAVQNVQKYTCCDNLKILIIQTTCTCMCLSIQLMWQVLLLHFYDVAESFIYIWCLYKYWFCLAWRHIASFIMPRPKRQYISLNIQIIAGFYFLFKNCIFLSIRIIFRLSHIFTRHHL